MNRTIIAALFFHHPKNLDKQPERQRLPTLLSLRVLNAESQPQPEQRTQMQLTPNLLHEPEIPLSQNVYLNFKEMPLFYFAHFH